MRITLISTPTRTYTYNYMMPLGVMYLASYLDFISNRDAVKLSINFTPYPDIIVKMMQIVVQNALEENKKKSDKEFKIPLRSLIINHLIVSKIYEAYFMARRLLSPLISKYRADTINLDLNKQETLKLSIDHENIL